MPARSPLGGLLQGCDLGGRWKASRLGSVARPEDATGLRGLTDVSFEIPHRLRDGTFWDSAPEPADTGERYDLVIVGARDQRPRRCPLLAASRRADDQRILILDPLEQPGGHAAQNNFSANGDGGGARTLIGYGGSQTIDSPSAYSRPAAALPRDVGIELARFDRYFDSGFNRRFGLKRSTFFDEETYGRDQLAVGTQRRDPAGRARSAAPTKLELARLELRPPNPYAGLERRARLRPSWRSSPIASSSSCTRGWVPKRSATCSV